MERGREGGREARVSWSTEADTDQREEAARDGRHTGGHRRGPLARRHGRRRAPLDTMADAAPQPRGSVGRRRRAPLRPSSSSSISPSCHGVPSRRQALAAHDGVPRLRRGPTHGPRWCSSPATAPRERASPVAAGVAALWCSLLTLRPSAPQLLTCYSKP